MSFNAMGDMGLGLVSLLQGYDKNQPLGERITNNLGGIPAQFLNGKISSMLPGPTSTPQVPNQMPVNNNAVFSTMQAQGGNPGSALLSNFLKPQ